MSDLFPDAIVTERLRMERESVADSDLGARYESMSTDAVDDDELAHVPIEPFEHLGDAREYVAQREGRMRSGDAGTYVVRPRSGEDGGGEAPRASDGRAGDARETGDPAGEAELFALWDRRTAYFTFGLRKRFWGRGYSGERAAAFVSLAFDRLDLECVSVSHLVGNENSRRAVQKYVDRFGGRCEGVRRNGFPLDGEPRDAVEYSISRDEYAESDEDPVVEFVDDTDGHGTPLDEGGER